MKNQNKAVYQSMPAGCNRPFQPYEQAKADEILDKDTQGWSKAFTLIELLVVVLIIGILTAVALPQYSKAVEKSRLSGMQQKIPVLEQALDAYILEAGYPSSAQGTEDLWNVLGINYSSFSDGVVNPGYRCNAKKECILMICISSDCFVSITYFPKGTDQMPDYALYSRKQAGGTWTRTYSSCYKDISNMGLEALGYSSEPC